MHEHLGSRSYAILLALSDGERHGYDIMKQVILDSDGALHLGPATLYTSLKRLLELGYIIELDERVDAEHGDARRRYYKLSGTGVEALEQESARAQKFSQLAARRLA